MELQQFICENNNNYESIFKENGFILRYDRKKNLLLVKNHYDKPLTFTDDLDYWKMYCRGAIINTETNRVICVPPVKSQEKELYFFGSYPDKENIYPLIDGTMINIFYKDEWIMSTRSGIGGYNKWTNKKSFRKLFEECCDFNMNELDTTYCYSFVLRHIENRNVSPIKQNELYLVEMYSLPDLIRISQKNYPTICKKIEPIPFTNELSYETKGYTIKYGSKRYKWRNPLYEEVKELKANENNHSLNYIILRQNGNLKKYLQYFPEHRLLFDTYREKIHKLSNDLYTTYKNVFIYKTFNKKEIPYHLNPLIYNIHGNYLRTKEPTTWDDIKDYIHQLPPKKLQFALNYVQI